VRLAVDLTLAAWALLELGLRVLESVHGRGHARRDRGTRILIALALVAAIATAAAMRPLWTSAPPRVVGLVLMWLGLGVRGWAIAALGANFRTTVEVERDQTVVSTGPYRYVRHPSYTGLLLIAAGFGVTRGSWVSLAACGLLLLPAIVRRIRVEEEELTDVLGDAYLAYGTTTPARLVPRLW
jgi:protein-S-isoprenylcysteine O-methyltransferase Ste14